MSNIKDHPSFRGAKAVLNRASEPAYHLKTTYILSPQGRILDVGGDWDRFAWKNSGLEAVSDFVVGRNLSDFLDGFETASFINAILFICRRRQKPFEMIMRCDSETEMNLFRMNITPAENNALTVSHRLLLTRSFPDFTVPADSVLRLAAPRCSVCCSFKSGRVWVDPLSQTKTAFTASHHVICPDCKARAREALSREQMPPQKLLRVVT